MQRADIYQAALSLALGLLSTGCVRSSSDNGPPSYSESEFNDTAAEANYFGVLNPGDRFIIRGDISDQLCDPFNYCDPFDGFAFTAGQAIHVDFALVADLSSHDFDVCIYDPQLDLTIDCFQSGGRTELGGVDIFAGGLDFHLVLESYIGTGGYDLEIDVYPLFGLEAGGSEMEPSALDQGIAADRSDAAPSREDASSNGFAAYGIGDLGEVEADEPATQFIRIDINKETGVTVETIFNVLPDGSIQPAQ
ncbi:MAG: hypothetical protein ACI8QS_003287 [Planctomycetota bacterium]|jgi:hypothetical protein